MTSSLSIRAPATALVLSVAACSAPGAAPSGIATVEPSEAPPTSGAAEWIEPDVYSFGLAARCGERSLLGEFAVEVAGGEVIASRALDRQGVLARSAPADFPTLADLLALAGRARDEGAVVDLVTDPVDGRPVSLHIDWIPEAMDDEECYTVSDLVITK